MPDDHLVDVGLRKLLGLDLVFLAGPQQVVEEGDVELQDLDELDDAAVRDVELAVEVEGAGVALGAVLGDLAVVDITGQLGGVLVLLVLGLERADAHAVLLREDQAAHADVLQGPGQVAVVLLHPLVEHLAAERAEVALDGDGVGIAVGVELGVQGVEELVAVLDRHQVKRLLVHRAVVMDRLAVVVGLLAPGEGEERAVVGLGVRLHALLQEPRDGALGTAHRSVEQEDSPFRPVPMRRALEDVDQAGERLLEAEDRVLAVVIGVIEELVASQSLLVDERVFRSIGEDHVVEPLIGRARDTGIVAHDLDVLGEGPMPVLLLIIRPVLAVGDQCDQIRSGGRAHERCSSHAVEAWCVAAWGAGRGRAVEDQSVRRAPDGPVYARGRLALESSEAWPNCQRVASGR